MTIPLDEKIIIICIGHSSRENIENLNAEYLLKHAHASALCPNTYTYKSYSRLKRILRKLGFVVKPTSTTERPLCYWTKYHGTDAFIVGYRTFKDLKEYVESKENK